MSAVNPTKPGLIFGWSMLLCAVVIAPLVPYPLDFGAVTFFGLIAQAFLGRVQMEPLNDQVTAHPIYWGYVVFPYYLSLSAGMLYCAFAKGTVINVLTEPGFGWYLLFTMLMWPLVPSVVRHERERYRNARF